MKQVAAYETLDGRVFSLKKDAEHHEASLELWEWADSVGLCSGGEWDRQMVVDSLLEHRHTLAKILNCFTEEVTCQN